MPPRSESPTPLILMGSRASSDGSYTRKDSFDSYYSEKGKESPSATGSNGFDNSHTASSSQATSRKASDPAPKPYSPTVNVYTHCGRHSDQYLFKGWSDLVRSFKKD
ncbi:hypothetical protein GGS23DRAFT_600495 [Durotheca rogersii]|uniref:uncharacterized protein n=1 Tax=Durotheca rogersii TaxID=419775 RepID=UPI00221FE0D6|nr:uncharacterized protein GGS23DRAFT_600495 [Durotheca rogersii]KAI5859370.1 hypothetical protein GGS23DRAFT_600495 [Durotheca rogersii]